MKKWRCQKDAKAHCNHKHFGASWNVFPMFFGICKIKKKKKKNQKKSSTLKHAVVHNDKFKNCHVI